MKNLKVKSILSILFVICTLLTIASLSSCKIDDCTDDCVTLTPPFVHESDGLTVQFGIVNVNNSSDCELIGTLNWNFGDGNTGSEGYHEYSAAGTYNICVTGTAVNHTSNTLCENTVCSEITVRDNSI